MSAPAEAKPEAKEATPLEMPAFGVGSYLVCLKGILFREGLRFLNQRERFVSSLVRPLLWLFIFAAGFRQVLGVSIIPPYKTYVLYEVYITPGLVGLMIAHELRSFGWAVAALCLVATVLLAVMYARVRRPG